MSKIKEIIYEQLSRDYEAKMRTLPPPPPGFYYHPELKGIEQAGDNFIITIDITLKKK